MSSPRSLGLDGLRGLAILLVLVFHLYDPASAKLTVVRHVGWIGVDLFFALSGFLITGILLDAKGRSGYFSTFYARRARRVFPVYYLALIVGLVIMPASAVTARLHEQQGWFWTYTANVAYGLYGMDGSLVLFLAKVALALLAAMASWHGFERWFLVQRATRTPATQPESALS